MKIKRDFSRHCRARWRRTLRDRLVHRILSFLPTKQAVKILLVSTRWRYVWTYVPPLEFDDGSFSLKANLWVFVERVLGCRRAAFRDFVDRVLGCRRLSRLRRISLWFSGLKDHDVPPHAGELIPRCIRNYGEEHFIKELKLSICINMQNLIELPGLLFNCESLTVMKLNSFPLQLPNSMHLPRLKDLQLLDFVIPDFSFQQLLSDCPKLKKLSMTNCSLVGFEIVDFSGCACLEILSMENCRRFDTKAIHISSRKLKTLIIDFVGDESMGAMKISAPNLLHFEYMGCLPRTLSIERLSSLVSAHINCLPLLFDGDDAYGYPLNKRVINTMLVLLGGLSNARTLVIAVNSVKLITRILDSSECLPTLFSNLECLELEIDVFDKDNIQRITSFLKLSPNLERLVINKHQIGFDYEKCWEIEEFPLEHLKDVEIRCINGSENLVNFSKFFLKNAVILETFSFHGLSAPQKHKIGKELLRAPRASLVITILML